MDSVVLRRLGKVSLEVTIDGGACARHKALVYRSMLPRACMLALYPTSSSASKARTLMATRLTRACHGCANQSVQADKRYLVTHEAHSGVAELLLKTRT